MLCSISYDMFASRRGVTDWFSIFVNWLASVTKAEVKSLNGCRPATPSLYMVFCMEHSVDPEVDLVVIEYSLNDGFDDSIKKNRIVMDKEQLVRRLMKLQNQPAVVFLQVPHVWPKYVHPFHHTSEDVEGALAAYYDVQTVSLRTSMFLLNLHHPTHGFLWNETYFNRHPIDTGHKAMADLVIHLIQEVAVGLYTWPASEQEVSWLKMPLPPPMHDGNYEPMFASCLVVDAFANLCISKEGWQWINEGTDTKPKWGFVSTTPGSELILRLGTPGVSGPATAAVVKNTTFPLLIHYLLSYAPMGQVSVDCLGGCYCQKRVNGHLSNTLMEVSVTHMVLLDVTWKDHSLPCDMRVTVLNDTTSDGHKFKVSGVVFAATNSLAAFHAIDNWIEF
ncbi:hypothetical protein Vafri_9308 [Volvox africanus]|uniref:SGNH hydrolase-type esterase domain-containing protein n=1 Tax=Volvox africanus TaxID=51714 RepID=A0A8J4EZK0_9CHLO|nr:hypothetical protein Vafri_9308 [Volvox africanus]